MSDTIPELVKALQQGSKRAAAKLITIIERGDHTAEIVRQIYPLTGKAYIVGITGSPGAGKSTLTNALAEAWLAEGKKVGVIAVDPTSPFSGGALLGDRIRLKANFQAANLFIRSMANRGHLGGIALATQDAIKVLDAFGCDLIVVETVGVGQSEVEIFKATHTTLVVVVPGMGDDIQAIKAGIMEITDIFVVNKMDLPGAQKRAAEIEAMLDLGEHIRDSLSASPTLFERNQGWRPPVVLTNAMTGEGIPDLVARVRRHHEYQNDSGAMLKRLEFKYKSEILAIVKYRLTQQVEEMIFGNDVIHSFVEQVVERVRDPCDVADQILDEFIDLDRTPR
jgi:LAO/AO transport system kinase